MFCCWFQQGLHVSTTLCRMHVYSPPWASAPRYMAPMSMNSRSTLPDILVFQGTYCQRIQNIALTSKTLYKPFLQAEELYEDWLCSTPFYRHCMHSLCFNGTTNSLAFLVGMMNLIEGTLDLIAMLSQASTPSGSNI